VGDLLRSWKRRALKANGRRQAAGEGYQVLAFTASDTRSNSAMANAGISQEVRQKLTGHTSAETNKVYTHHELQALRAAVAVIPRIGAQ